MEPAVLSLFLIGAFFLSYGLVYLILKYSRNNAVLDIPNERSSHANPTPTGGGLAISICAIVFLSAQLAQANSDHALVWVLLPPLIVVTLTGWIDDHYSLRTVYRAGIYLLSAIWVVSSAGGITVLNLLGLDMGLGWSGMALAVIAIVWIINLYNFMDGIDGLAAIEAMTTSLAMAVLFYLSDMRMETIFSLIILVSTSAYLLWNWSPAKIFMGDVGSCALGLLFSTLAVWSHNSGGPSVYVWLILLAVFIADATYTLIYRISQRAKWYSAHRSHAYQKLVQRGLSHTRVTLAVLLLNITVLWPLAWCAFSMPDYAVVFTVISYVLLALIWSKIQLFSHESMNSA